MRNVHIAISQGMLYRDIVRLGVLRSLLERAPDVRVVLLTQAYAVQEVLDEVQHERVVVRRHDIFKCPSRWPSYALLLRRLARSRSAINTLARLEAGIFKVPGEIDTLFSELPPSLVVTTHPLEFNEWDIIASARRRRFRTASIVKSWDNILRRPRSRGDTIAVWSRANRREAIEVEQYRDDEVHMIGPTCFDRYFTEGVFRDRSEYWRSKGLDPEKPVVVFGTAGSFSPDWDETFMMDLLLEMTEQDDALRDVQFVCRLHFMSHLEHFWPYRDHPRVVLSFGSYLKTLGWCPTVPEVDDFVNMLHHADAIITPASTLVLEGPIVDTPTIATLFSTVRPDLHARATETGWLQMHFKPLVENDWLPMARTPEDLREMLKRALREPTWYGDERRGLVDEYVTFRDGRSHERAAAYIDSMAPHPETPS